jgi:hypothetical protein
MESGGGVGINDFIMEKFWGRGWKLMILLWWIWVEGRYEAFDCVVLSFYIVIHRDDAN